MKSVRQFGCATDAGIERKHNEDSLLAMPESGLWVVADGMGGYEAGEVASKLVVEALPVFLQQGMDLPAALEAANCRIHEVIDSGEGSPGMGSTVVAMHLRDNRYNISWVGDSRAYLWNGSSLIQLTHDHSFVQQLLDSGMITQEEALNHPQRNVISQALGGGMRQIMIDSISGELLGGQQVLLCSDGLTSELRDEQIAAILAMNRPCQTTVELLIKTAKKHGGKDNITVLLVNAQTDARSCHAENSTTSMRCLLGRLAILVLLGFCLVALAVGIEFFLST